jgi:hypothetical protein
MLVFPRSLPKKPRFQFGNGAFSFLKHAGEPFRPPLLAEVLSNRKRCNEQQGQAWQYAAHDEVMTDKLEGLRHLGFYGFDGDI